MGFFNRFKPSPALIVAMVALCAALVGTAIAGPPGFGLNKKEKKQTRKISKKQANKRITARAPGLSVANATNATNAQNAQNAQNAASAQSAVNAQNAGNANTVNGMGAERLFFAADTGSAQQTVLNNFGGLTLKAQCDGGGLLQIEATTSVGNVEFWYYSVSFGDVLTADADGQFQVGETVDIDADIGGDEITGTMTYVRPDGVVVVVHFLAEESFSTGAGAKDCGFAGQATVK